MTRGERAAPAVPAGTAPVPGGVALPAQHPWGAPAQALAGTHTPSCPVADGPMASGDLSMGTLCSSPGPAPA